MNIEYKKKYFKYKSKYLALKSQIAGAGGPAGSSEKTTQKPQKPTDKELAIMDQKINVIVSIISNTEIFERKTPTGGSVTGEKRKTQLEDLKSTNPQRIHINYVFFLRKSKKFLTKKGVTIIDSENELKFTKGGKTLSSNNDEDIEGIKQLF